MPPVEPTVPAAPIVQPDTGAPTPVTAAEPGSSPVPAPTADAPAAPLPGDSEQPAQPFTPPTPEPSLFQTAGTEEPKPQDAAPPPVEEPKAPTYEPFELPEGFEGKPERLSEYTAELAKYGISQEAGQALIAMHAEEQRQFAEQTVARQWEAFAQTKSDWAKAAKDDPEIGGARFQTSMHLVAVARDRILPASGPVRAAFDKMLDDTGVGNHPEFLRAWSRLGAMLSEPAPPPPAQKPPPDIGRKPNGRAFADIYNHPTSQQVMR
jgi:hypothetical protein